MTAIVPSRTYTFTQTPEGYQVQWTDVAHNRFEDNYLIIVSPSSPTSPPSRLISQQFGVLPFRYSQRTITNDGSTVSMKVQTLDPFGNDVQSASVGTVGPNTLAFTSAFTVITQLIAGPHGEHPGIDESMDDTYTAAVNVSRNVPVPWSYTQTYDGATQLTEITPAHPVTLVLPGDFRRPASARSTAALSDDEVFAVNQLAGLVGMSGPQMLAILLVLTGARRDAFHSDGFFGMANLTAAQIAEAGGDTAAKPEDLVNRSTLVQLAVAGRYLKAHAITGPVSVFLTLATGVPSLANSGHIPLHPRLAPLSSNGITITADDVLALVNPRVAAVSAEFAARLPQSVTTSNSPP